VRRAAFVAQDGRRILVLETSEAVDETVLRTAVAWAQVDAVRFIESMPVDPRHNAKIDYPRLRRWLAAIP
jgi:hypothetical protein